MVQFVLWMVYLMVHHWALPLCLAVLVAMQGLDAVSDGVKELGVRLPGVFGADTETAAVVFDIKGGVRGVAYGRHDAG